MIRSQVKMAADKDITELLDEWSSGDPTALPALIPQVYDELRRTARLHLAHEKHGHTLQATEIVNEAFLKFAQRRRVAFRCRAQFFAFASQVMRRFLVDYARARHADKRGGNLITVALEDAGDVASLQGVELVRLIDLDAALTRLNELDPDLVRVIEVRFFAGFTVAETASVSEMSPAKVKREWAAAKRWLARELGGTDTTPGMREGA